MPNQTITEGDLVFSFPDAVKVERLDRQGVPLPVGMTLVDFVITEEQPRRLILLELKDPSDPGSQQEARDAFFKELRGNDLVNNRLTPKARDSFTFLHLMAEDGPPVLFVVLLGLERCPLDAALLLSLKERLLRRLRQEADRPWQREYVEDCLILTEAGWNRHFPQYPVARHGP
jgi:hypothetical protein